MSPREGLKHRAIEGKLLGTEFVTGRYCESGQFSGTRTDDLSKRADVLEKLDERTGNSGPRGPV